MPKDEFDFEDPLELNGQVVLTQEDTTEAMCECFIEEFMRMGYSANRIYALFRNHHYLGMHLVWQKRGEQFVRGAITALFARWGRPVTWRSDPAPFETERVPAPQPIELDAGATDPMGAPIPQINL